MELKHNLDVEHTHHYLLLIVPYGIETVSNLRPLQSVCTFNRTLWN